LPKVDFIIVGQGIAGTALAHGLRARGRSFVVIDQPRLSACSKVSGGVYNPVVFKRLTKSWLADALIPVMHEFYQGIESLLAQKLVYPIRLVHTLANADEENLWKKKAANELADFIDPAIHKAGNAPPLAGAHYAYVKEAGYIDLGTLLLKSREYFAASDAFLEEEFSYGELVPGETVRYRDIEAEKIIFCEGYLYRNNPWFSHLPFKPAKGEILTIRCEELQLEPVFTSDFFILPLREPHHFKVGATYEWEQLDDLPTEAGRQTLVEKFSRSVPFSFEMLKHEAGVRPATADRRPVLGIHPEQPNLAIFNGLGTKGVMLAPYFAKHFCSFMLDKAPLWQEVNVKRFF
jgi:glycine oxidase